MTTRRLPSLLNGAGSANDCFAASSCARVPRRKSWSQGQEFFVGNGVDDIGVVALDSDDAGAGVGTKLKFAD